MGFRNIFGGATTRTDFTAGVTELEVGGWMGHHCHEPAEIYYVFTGEGVVTSDDEDHPVSAGSAAHIPSNSEHAIRNTGNGPLRLFYAFAVGLVGPDRVPVHRAGLTSRHEPHRLLVDSQAVAEDER